MDAIWAMSRQLELTLDALDYCADYYGDPIRDTALQLIELANLVDQYHQACGLADANGMDRPSAALLDAVYSTIQRRAIALDRIAMDRANDVNGAETAHGKRVRDELGL